MKQHLGAAFSLSTLLLITACGGGGGGSSTPTANTPSSSASSAASSSSLSSSSLSSSVSSQASSSSSSGISQAAMTFTNVAVHDPSILKVDNTYYVFGSHLAAAKTTDFMNWTKVADGVTASNSLFNDVTKELKDAFAWSQVTGLWAADVIQLGDGKFYFYYNSCKGDSPRSALGLAVADKVTGPYVNKQIFLKSGMWNAISEDGVTIYDAQVQPNAVDPDTFFDKDGNLWMIYGSYSGGIFILAMDKTTGLPKPNQGYGKHLLGGYHARIEGAYVIYNAQTGYYYMFTSFGGLDANGAYNLRVARSLAPDGPYLDAKGTDMATVKGNPNKIFDDVLYQPYGQKLMGNHQFTLAAGETGTALGYVSAGHNSAYYEPSTNQYFMVFHTRFPNRGEEHEVRVHEIFFNQDGWLVVAPFRYVPLSSSSSPLSAEVTSNEVAGSYKYINHGKDITTTIVQSQLIQLSTDGKVTGAVTGTWAHKGNNYVAITLDSGGLFNGVLSRQWNSNANQFTVTFTAQSNTGVSIWGAKLAN